MNNAPPSNTPDELHDAKQRLLETTDSMSPMQNAQKHIEQTIRDQPWTALITALSAGLIVGLVPPLRRGLRRALVQFIKHLLLPR